MKKRVENYTEEDRKKLGDSTRGKVWIRFLKENNEYDSNYIMKEDLDKWISLGWEKGRIPSIGNAVSQSNKNRVNQAIGTKWMHRYIDNNIQRKRIPIKDIEIFIKNNWVLGYK